LVVEAPGPDHNYDHDTAKDQGGTDNDHHHGGTDHDHDNDHGPDDHDHHDTAVCY
jgi:hypothetical protein